MNAQDLYAQLEKDFITKDMGDEWAEYMEDIKMYLSENFKTRSMGVVCDFAQNITCAYTAVFPSERVMQYMIDRDVSGAVLFLHHPEIWDIRQMPPFYNMNSALLDIFRERNIAIYNLHVPLDQFHPYGTSVNLANALDLLIERPFAPYFGAMAGVIATSKVQTIEELQKKFAQSVGHDVALYAYGEKNMHEQKIALVAGGGLGETIEEVYEAGATVFVTGVSSVILPEYQKAHDFAKEKKISILGGTHYSTEKFACQKMVTYFTEKGLSTEFIVDEPLMDDL